MRVKSQQKNMRRGQGYREEKKEKVEEYDPTRTRYLYEESLPLLELFKRGTSTQVVEALRVSKKWRRLLNNNAFWKELLFHRELRDMLFYVHDMWRIGGYEESYRGPDVPNINLKLLGSAFYTFISKRDEDLLLTLNKSMATLFIIIWYALPRAYYTGLPENRHLENQDLEQFDHFESTCIIMNVKFMTLYGLYRTTHRFTDNTREQETYYMDMLQEILPQMTLDDACVNQAVPYYQLNATTFKNKQYGRVPQFLLVDKRVGNSSPPLYLIQNGNTIEVIKETGSIAFGIHVTPRQILFSPTHSRAIVNVSAPYFFFIYEVDDQFRSILLRKTSKEEYIECPNMEVYLVYSFRTKIQSEIQ